MSRMYIGFVNPKMETRSWKELVETHQAGGSLGILYSGSRTRLGRRMARIGGKLKKAGDPDARFFFLRSARASGRERAAHRRVGSYTGMMLPPRPIVDPFWQVNENEAAQNIVDNFHRKMAGERI